MKTLFTILLAVHIAAGITSLITGIIISASKKGNKRHRRLGRIFYFGMLIITGTAVAMTQLHPNSFLLSISFFSLFQAVAGKRVINNKGTTRSVIDYLLLIGGALVSIWMMTTGNIVLVFFGVLNAAAAVQYFRFCFLPAYRGPGSYENRLKVHITMMGGSFIATLTAFAVVNVPQSWYNYLPFWLPWILPTLAFAPVMARWSRKYTGRKKSVLQDKQVIDQPTF